jgi:hypothetical protein
MRKDLLAQNFQREILQVFLTQYFHRQICKHVFAQYFQKINVQAIL